MAKRARGGRSGGRQAKATSKKKEKAPKPAPAAEVEVVEESGGAGVETGIVVFTFLALVVAFVMVDQFLGPYGEGLFFKEQ